MKIFLDSANLDEIRQAVETGILDGLTTNPTLASRNKDQGQFKDYLHEIFQMVNGPVHLEVLATDHQAMVDEARKLAGLNEKVVVKIPMGQEGIKAVKTLAPEGIKTNITLVFSASQALLAAKAGANYVSAFVGRLHDAAQDGIDLVADIRTIFFNYDFKTEVLVASDRTVMDTVNAALIGAGIITVKFKNFMKLFEHPLTDQGLQRFLEDWQQSGQQSLV
jgi:transaldolase